jgi:hypothetical protein
MFRARQSFYQTNTSGMTLFITRFCDCPYNTPFTSARHSLQVFRTPTVPKWAWSDIPGNTRTDTRLLQPPGEHLPSAQQSAQLSAIVLSPRTSLSCALMSHSHLSDLTASSSSNFQLIFNNALKAYEKRTKKDLLAHPLASQLQACDSPTAILAILRLQVQGLDQSRSGDDRWTKWLGPTINVLYTFSATLGEGVSLVSLRTLTCLRYTFISYIYDRYSHQQKSYLQA